eukprot:TRINITY_DN19123_c0_g1_i1.p1 TRINITY_DN19123_c0_g1~~TRINITY_DN19123_c0_g1_i1.p1  ORF type:complete len:212 (+),score=29.24 TRINITY_DN19123_c0_g1_i1:69-638(+)
MARPYAPYMVLSHQAYCPVCRRAVEEEELCLTEDDEAVHLGCGGVVEEQGYTAPSGSERCVAGDLELIDGVSGAEADWLTAQMAILAALPGGKATEGSGMAVAMLGAAAAQSAAQNPRKPQVQLEGPCIASRGLAADAGKRRRGAPKAQRENQAARSTADEDAVMTAPGLIDATGGPSRHRQHLADDVG